MGRSENSRNRRFVADGGALRTEPVDAGGSRPLARDLRGDARAARASTSSATATRRARCATRSPRAATSRTPSRRASASPTRPTTRRASAALLDLRGAAPALALSILRASDADPAQTDRTTFRPAPPPPGVGLGLTTYRATAIRCRAFAATRSGCPLEGDAASRCSSATGTRSTAGIAIALAVKRIPRRGRRRSTLLVRNRHALASWPGAGRIAVVDDEDSIRETLEEFALAGRATRSPPIADGAEAWSAFQRRAARPRDPRHPDAAHGRARALPPAARRAPRSSRSSSSPRATRSSTACSASSSAPTTTSASRSRCASSSRA